MNKPIIFAGIAIAAIAVLTTGCTDRSELTEKGFVMGVALDKSETDKIKMTTQIFRPSQGVSAIGGKAAETAYANIITEGETVSRAIRDIPINLGRKTQWSHIRVILVSAQLAREQGVNDILEFFYRDHEPRLTVSILIADGQASEYLQQQPFIENTISQQLFESVRSTAANNSKTAKTDLLHMGLQLKSQVGNALLPYLYLSKDSKTVTNVVGVALLKKGKLVGVMEPRHSERLHMIRGEYTSGMLDIPCGNDYKKTGKIESVEILKHRSKIMPNIKQDSLQVRVMIDAEVAIMELACSKLDSLQAEQKLAKKIEDLMQKNITDTIAWMQNKKFDAIGLGNLIYRKDPKVWKKWKKDWDTRFAEAPFDVHVKIKINNSGTEIGKPTFQK